MTTEELVTGNLGLAESIARRYQGRGLALEDLVQEAAIGLLHAAERFDADRGAKFSTYATWWIRRALMDALGEARTIRIPRSARRQMAAVFDAERQLRGHGTDTPSNDAIAARVGLSARTVGTLRTAAYVGASLDEPVGGEATRLGELVTETTDRDAQPRPPIWPLLRRLPQRHREILVRRYGLGGADPETHEQIGASLGVGTDQSRQLERQALRALREIAGTSDLAA